MESRRNRTNFAVFPAPFEGGAATLFFVAVMLPLFFLFFTLFLDVGSYYREQQRAQLALDEAALHSARFLPHVVNAQQAAQHYLTRFHPLTAEARVTIVPDGVSISLEHMTPLTFAQFFLPGIGIPFTAYSSARVDPVDAYIAVDTSRRVIPAEPSLVDKFMGDLPAATFFAHDNPVVVNGAQLDARFLTAQCFNRLFSTIKRTAISVHTLLAAFRMNAVGIGLYPSQFGVFDVREMSLVGDIDSFDGREAVFPSYNRVEAQTDWCAAAALFERVALDDYSFPAGLDGIPQHHRASATGDQIVDPATFSFNEAYRPYVRASEAIWAATGRPELPQTDIVLREIASKLVVPRAEVRGGLRNSALAIGIILAGDLPWIYLRERDAGGIEQLVPRKFGESAAVAEQLREALLPFRTLAATDPLRRFQLYYVLFAHEDYREAIFEQRSSLESLFDNGAIDPLSGSRLPNLSMRVVVVQSPEEAMRQISTALAFSGRQAVLSR